MRPTPTNPMRCDIVGGILKVEETKGCRSSLRVHSGKRRVDFFPQLPVRGDVAPSSFAAARLPMTVESSMCLSLAKNPPLRGTRDRRNFRHFPSAMNILLQSPFFLAAALTGAGLHTTP